jgi:hypothetical protein
MQTHTGKLPKAGAREHSTASLYLMFCLGWDAALVSKKRARKQGRQKEAAWREFVERR